MRIPARPTPVHWLISLLVAFAALLTATAARSSAPTVPPGPDRYKISTVQYTAHEWLMAAYKGNRAVCKIVVDYEGKPTLKDVYIDCGDTLTNQWVAQKPCMDPSKPERCDGYYIYYLGNHPAQKDVALELPEPSVWVDLADCTPVWSQFTSVCEFTPKLTFKAQEPLADYHITRVEGRVNGASFGCDGDTCSVELKPTGNDKGSLVEFWAYSDFGDSSKRFTAQVRVTQVDFGNPDQVSWYVDVLSTQWAGIPLASCADTWNVFPPVGGPPAWLATPNDVNDMATHIPYNYLAANLIRQGQVDVNRCPNNGLLADGQGANQCGLTAARSAVNEWQNRFDGLILDVSHATGVPAQMLKNLFARESQFWPGAILRGGDTGLGQITDKGADTTLFWNAPFFNDFCPLVLSQDTCDKGYMSLKQDQQEMLRYALVNSVNATCANCPLGIDLERANYSVKVFANTLMANCQQAGQVVWNYAGQKKPGDLNISYEDMWKFTLANYNAGGGCLATAIEETLLHGQSSLTWENVSPYLEPACQGAVDYVNDISQ